MKFELVARQRRTVLQGVEHGEDVMVLKRVEETGKQQHGQRDPDRHRAEQAAQTDRQKHEKRAIHDDEEIIEPKIEPQPERMGRLIAQLFSDRADGRR